MSGCGCDASINASACSRSDTIPRSPKGWDGVLRNADEVMNQLFGTAAPTSPTRVTPAWPSRTTHPKARDVSDRSARWRQLSPASAGLRASGWPIDEDESRQKNPAAWVPVVPRPRLLRRAGGPQPDQGPATVPSAPTAPGTASLPNSLPQKPIFFGEDDSFSVPSTAFQCDGWRATGHAAPLLDPGVHGHITDCQTDPDTRFRLWVTSVCTLRLHNQSTRLYFFDGKFKNNLSPDFADSPFPPFVVHATDDTRNIYKFTHAMPTNQDLATFWKSDRTGESVANLHFCRDLIGFTDSEDGFEFPIYTPIVSNLGAGCDFSDKPSVYYSWRWNTSGVPRTQNVPAGAQDGRAGWRSTVIPCRGEAVVYQSHAVLRIDVDGDDYYLMLAVRCDGRSRGPNHSDSAMSECCDVCAPPGDLDNPGCSPSVYPCLSDDQIPTTDLVLFISPSPNFQAGTLGPYGLLREPPAWQSKQWVGVPTAFESPEGRFVFLYVHPQPPDVQSKSEHDDNSSSTSGRDLANPYGLFCARKDDLRAAMRTLLGGAVVELAPANLYGLHPGRSEAEVEAMLEAGRALFAPLFFSLGPIEVCGRGGLDADDVQRMNWVDEHFMFRGDRLRMYATHLGRSRVGASQPVVLDKLVRCGAEASFDPDALDAVMEEHYPWDFPRDSLRRVFESLLRFKLAPCAMVRAAELDRWATLTSTLTEVNDPAVDLYTLADGSVVTRLLFHCANAGGLLVQWTHDDLGNEEACDVP